MSSSEANARTRGKALVFEVVQGPELVVQTSKKWTDEGAQVDYRPFEQPVGVVGGGKFRWPRNIGGAL